MAVKIIKGPKGHAGGLFGANDGKGASAQTLLPGQKSTLAGGDTMSRAMGQYGKGHSYLPPGTSDMGPAAMDPTVHAGTNQIRGDQGGLKSNPRSGGLGEGKLPPPTTALSD
jgi:hypothetical protein